MKIKDKNIKKFVDVSDKECVTGNRPCYWPRPDPGVFTPGIGYKTRGNKTSSEHICGTRAIHGCPDEYCKREPNGTCTTTIIEEGLNVSW